MIYKQGLFAYATDVRHQCAPTLNNADDRRRFVSQGCLSRGDKSTLYSNVVSSTAGVLRERIEKLLLIGKSAINIRKSRPLRPEHIQRRTDSTYE